MISSLLGSMINHENEKYMGITRKSFLMFLSKWNALFEGGMKY